MIKIDINQDVTSRLPLLPFPEYNDLCIAKLQSVESKTTTSKEDANWEYAGMEIPILNFTLIGFKKNKDEKDRFKTISFGMISNIKKDQTERTTSALEVSYRQMYEKMRHLYDQYAANGNYKAWDIPVEFNTDSSPEDRIKQFTDFFAKVETLFTKGKDGVNPVWADDQYLAMVMLASGKKLSYLDIPDFVGKGIFDMFKLKNGKIDTHLLLPPNATVELGLGNQEPTHMQNDVQNDMPDALKGLV